MRRLALPARLAHMVAEAANRGRESHAALLAVVVTERGLGGDGVDLDRRVARLFAEKSPRAKAARHLAARLASQAVQRPEAAPYPLPDLLPAKHAAIDEASAPPSPRPSRAKGQGEELRRAAQGHSAANIQETASAEAGPILLHAWPDRIAKARGERGRYLLANGSGAMLDAADPLAGETFLVVADLQGKAQGARITSAAAVSEADIRAALAHRIETRTETAFDLERRGVRMREVVRLGAIKLSERMLPAPTGEAADRAALEALRQHGLSLLPWSRETETLRQRLRWLHRGLGSPWPDMSDEALLARREEWLAPFLSGEASFARIDPGVLREGLMSLVPHELQRRIAALAPTHFDAPSGSHVPIRYDGEWPVLAIRVQELFGLDHHPSIAGGAVPLTLELLSPAHRPVQTTRDLPGFWRGSWGDVRADMRGRYPKHVWPEDPLAAEATARAKPRLK